ncbi:restriction endonuclease subunit S [Ectopseudomonas hydrolytica]|uniref:restriction endonuclease subunit S n=1 Tax=Ectopseudomonas hydrolytica TaxID=2493633 RepID=UPI003C2DD71A
MSGELPRGWVNTTIGEINDYSSCNIDPLKEPEQVFELYSVPIYPTGRPEYVRGQDIGSTKQSVEPGDVLLCKINPRINRVWMVGPKSEWPQIGSSEWVVIRQPLIHAGFLRYQLSESSFREKLCSEVSGVGGSLTRAQPKKVATYSLVLPPAAEQTRIAAKLDELLAQVDTLKARIDDIPALLKRFRQSVLAAAVSGRLTEEWRRTHDIDEPEVSWKAIELVEISALVTSGSRGWANYYASNGAIFIRSQDINTDELDTSETAFVRLPESSEGKRTRVQVQDILITITGANVGKVARVKQALPEAYVSQHVALVRLQRPELAPFVELYLKDVGSGRKKLTELAYGGGKPGLNLSNIRDLAFALPSLEEQTEIVRRVEQLFAFAEQLEAKVASAKIRIEHLTQSILAKAFRGELVPQDPNDEPASVLLECIKTQRAAAPKAKRGRKASA